MRDRPTQIAGLRGREVDELKLLCLRNCGMRHRPPRSRERHPGRDITTQLAGLKGGEVDGLKLSCLRVAGLRACVQGLRASGYAVER